MAAPTEEELIAALGKHHHHAEQADNEKSATKTKSADMFDMSKVETAKETTWRSGAAGGVTNNQAIKGNNFMKDGKYDPPMFCDDSEHCTPGQRWPGRVLHARFVQPRSVSQLPSRRPDAVAMGAARQEHLPLGRQGESIQENRVQGSHER